MSAESNALEKLIEARIAFLEGKKVKCQPWDQANLINEELESQCDGLRWVLDAIRDPKPGPGESQETVMEEGGR